MTLEQAITFADAQGVRHDTPLRSLLAMRGPELYAWMQTMGFPTTFQDATFESILARMLERVPDSLDKRQGSVIWDALAPAALELTKALLEMEGNRLLAYASTSTGKWLDMRVAEHGLARYPATNAVRIARFWANDERTTPYDSVPIGGVYSMPNSAVNYVAWERLAGGIYSVRCQEPGASGNIPNDGSELLPFAYMPGCAAVVLGEIIEPGKDEETDEALFARFVKWITRPPFGGNRSDYEKWFAELPGVGPVKLYRADPEKGHVRAVILGADYAPPDPVLVDNVQSAVDPIVNSGEGIGLAPMAHMVHVQGAQGTDIDVDVTVMLASGWTVGQVQPNVQAKIGEYLNELRMKWAQYVAIDSPAYVDTVVRVAYIEAAILGIEGVTDVSGTTLNGQVANVVVDADCVPLLGEVILNE